VPLHGPVRLVVADDHRAFRESVLASLAATGEIEVVAALEDGADALDAVRALEPDVALLDLNMPGLTGAEVALRLRDEESPSRVLIISGYTDREIVSACLLAGAAGFLSKEASTEEIVLAIAEAAGRTSL
jgi:two-component system, NarL family, nitrate/nitrite response regulator NarL